jgi:tetratricopeptide (TPR) repeat protein
MRTLATLIVFLTLATSAGCQSSAKSGSLDQALADYNAGRYPQAESQAVQAMNTSSSPMKEEAAYIAGLSAYRQGRHDEAERRFTLAAQSADTHTSGSAKAMLGELRLDQNRPREAAAYFAEASNMLEDDDSRQAARHAALAYQQAGDDKASQQWMEIASGSQGGSTTGPSTVASAAASSMPTKGFALQVGAFSDKKRAQRAASDAQAIAKRDGLGPVRVINRRDDRGKPLYLVQFGFFNTRDAAAAARTRLGKLEYIVTAVSGT